jgi:hypothetical protein
MLEKDNKKYCLFPEAKRPRSENLNRERYASGGWNREKDNKEYCLFPIASALQFPEATRSAL